VQRIEGGSRSISRVLSWTAIRLGVPLPARSSSLPGSSASHAHASLFGLAPDGVCRTVRVTTAAVSSYLAISPLPAPSAMRTEASAVCFLLHFPSPHGARPLAGILLCGARTFLSAPGFHLLPSGCLTDFPGRLYRRAADDGRFPTGHAGWRDQRCGLADAPLSAASRTGAATKTRLPALI